MMTVKGYELRYYSGGKCQVTKPRPYDDAQYYWATSEDGVHWRIILGGKVQEEFKGEFPDLVERLEELNTAIQPRISHH